MQCLKCSKVNIYYSFAIHSSRDNDLIDEAIDYFKSQLSLAENGFPRNYDKTLFNTIKEIIDAWVNTDLNNENNKEIFESFKNILETYNFNFGLEHNEIINMIRNSSHEYVEELIDKIKEYYLSSDPYKIKSQCTQIFFLVTKNYLNSDLFSKHWNEAIALNKEIFIFILEPDLLDLNFEKFKNQKIFYYGRWMPENSEHRIELINFIKQHEKHNMVNLKRFSYDFILFLNLF